jgi:hypothetical protein
MNAIIGVDVYVGSIRLIWVFLEGFEAQGYL